jgi:hypothetical protein
MSEFKNANNDNITFFLEEKNNNNTSYEDIQKMLDEFTELTSEEENNTMNEIKFIDYNDNSNSNFKYFLHKENYGNDELFYEEEYTVKDLFKICKYYGLDKNIRTSKCKKQDIISTLVYFESLPENFKIVQKRNRMWAYITELLNDPKMRKYVMFN